MTTNLDLQELERKAYRSYFNDGLWDIMLGLTFLVLSMVPLFNEVWGLHRGVSYLLMFAILIPCWIGFIYLKKWITAPRMGLVKFGHNRQQKMRKLRIFMGGMVVLTIALIIMTNAGIFESLLPTLGSWSSYLFVASIFIVTFSVMAYMLDYGRLYFYGVLLAFEYPFSEWLAVQTGWVFPNGATLMSLLIIAIGLVTLIRFLYHYPLRNEEPS